MGTNLDKAFTNLNIEIINQKDEIIEILNEECNCQKDEIINKSNEEINNQKDEIIQKVSKKKKQWNIKKTKNKCIEKINDQFFMQQ